MASTKTIAHIVSVWPIEERAERPLFVPASEHNQSNLFVLPAATRDKPVILTVGPFIERIYVMKGRHTENYIGANDIAQDLVNQWAMQKHGSESLSRPGIAIWEEPNPTMEKLLGSSFLKEQIAAQDRFANRAVKHASDLNRSEHMGERASITSFHEQMAKYLGIENEPWQLDRMQVHSNQRVECIACTKYIPAHSMVCQYCHSVVDHARWAANEAAKRRAMADAELDMQTTPPMPPPAAQAKPPAAQKSA